MHAVVSTCAVIYNTNADIFSIILILQPNEQIYPNKQTNIKLKYNRTGLKDCLTISIPEQLQLMVNKLLGVTVFRVGK